MKNIFFLLTLISTIVEAQPFGTQVTSLPFSRTNTGIGAVNGKVLFAGGFSVPAGYSNLVDIFNSRTNAWSTLTLSDPIEKPATFTYKNKLLFIGGQATATGTWKMNIYDDLSGTIITRPVINANLIGTAMDSYSEKLYFAYLSGTEKKLHFFNMLTYKWDFVNVMLHPDYVANCGVLKIAVTKYFVYLTCSVENENADADFSVVWQINTRNGGMKKTTTPRYRRGGGIGRLTDNLLVLYGGTEQMNSTPILQADIYNVQSGQWSTRSMMPRYDIMFGSSPGKSHFIGSKPTGGQSYSYVDTYNISGGIWTGKKINKADQYVYDNKGTLFMITNNNTTAPASFYYWNF